jgi:hypothetical protein
MFELQEKTNTPAYLVPLLETTKKAFWIQEQKK